MAYGLVINKRFANKIAKINRYLEKEWSKETAIKFTKKVDQKIALILANPEMGSLTLDGVRKVVLTKHNKIYYRVKGKKVILINIFETRQNPNKNYYEP